MKKLAMLIAGGLFFAFCFSLTSCGQDPLTAKGEEVTQAQWEKAIDEVTKGFSLEDDGISFTVKGEEHYKDSLTTCTIKVKGKTLYLEESEGEDKQYIYAKKGDDGAKQYTSSDNSTWKVRTKLDDSASTVWENIATFAPLLKQLNHTYNQELSMYEVSIPTEYLSGDLKIKFLDQRVAYVDLQSNYLNATYIFTDYEKTSIPISEPEVKLSKLEMAYNAIVDKYGTSSCCTIGDDGSYIEVDTNPFDIDDYYRAKHFNILESINDELGFPDYVYQSMLRTTWSQGKQTATANGITVTWTYHPDKGLEAMYIESN